MPGSLRLGFRLYVASMALTPLIGAFDPAPAGLPVVAVALAVFALKAFLVWMSFRRRNWARIALLIYTGLALGAHAPGLLRSLAATPLLGVPDLLLVLVEIVAIILVFTPAAGRWYKPRPPPPASPPPAPPAGSPVVGPGAV